MADGEKKRCSEPEWRGEWPQASNILLINGAFDLSGPLVTEYCIRAIIRTELQRCEGFDILKFPK